MTKSKSYEDKDCLLSIIIAAYNVEAYIEECLESLLHIMAEGKAVEIIVVNDGSTDSTRKKIEGFITAHPEGTTLINQDNHGLGAARNAGIRASKGRYVCFVDGDDQLLPDARMPWQYLTEDAASDIVSIEIMQRDLRHHHGSSPDIRPYRRYVSPTGVRYAPARCFLLGRNIMPTAVTYIVRRQFLIDSNIMFREGIYHEDEDFTLRLFLYADSFIASGHCIYLYNLRPESITTTTDICKQEKKLRDLISIISDSLHLPNIEYARYKLHYLAVDILRLLIRQHHKRTFRQEIIASLRSLGLFPLPWHWETKYILFRLLTQLRFLFLR